MTAVGVIRLAERQLFAEDNVLRLVSYTHEDDALFYQCWLDPATQKGYNGTFSGTPEEFAAEDIPRFRFFASVVLRGSADRIGVVRLSPQGYDPDLAIWIYAPYRGRGYGTRAFRLASRHCLCALPVSALWAGCYENNTVSLSMLLASGFVRDPANDSVETDAFSGSRIVQLSFVLHRTQPAIDGEARTSASARDPRGYGNSQARGDKGMAKGLEKRPLGKTGLQVTFVGFGALEIGRDWGMGGADERARPADEDAGRVLAAVLDSGINLIDSAAAYHRSEERIGTYIANRRSSFVLASKCGEHNNEPSTYYDFGYAAIRRSIDESLVKLKTDTIDLMQIHFGPDQQKVLDDGETVAAMKDARAEGKVRFLGGSTGGHIARQCIESGDFDVMQLEYSLLNRGDEDLVNLCGERGIGVVLRGGLAYGRLTTRVLPHLPELGEREKSRVGALLGLVGGNGDLLTALALQFLYLNPNVSSVLAGSKRIEHIRANLRLIDADLGAGTLAQAIELTR